MEVESDFAESDHFRIGEKRGEPISDFRCEAFGVVRVNPDRADEIRLIFEQLQHTGDTAGLAGEASDCQYSLDARQPCPRSRTCGRSGAKSSESK